MVNDLRVWKEHNKAAMDIEDRLKGKTGRLGVDKQKALEKDLEAHKKVLQGLTEKHEVTSGLGLSKKIREFDEHEKSMETAANRREEHRRSRQEMEMEGKTVNHHKAEQNDQHMKAKYLRLDRWDRTQSNHGSNVLLHGLKRLLPNSNRNSIRSGVDFYNSVARSRILLTFHIRSNLTSPNMSYNNHHSKDNLKRFNPALKLPTRKQSNLEQMIMIADINKLRNVTEKKKKNTNSSSQHITSVLMKHPEKRNISTGIPNA